jgi:hypothetical protein
MASTSSSLCSVIDDTFGPYAGDCRGGLDFTLLFEESILSILPLALVLLAAPLRLLHLYKGGVKVTQSPLLRLKLVSVAFPRALMSNCLLGMDLSTDSFVFPVLVCNLRDPSVGASSSLDYPFISSDTSVYSCECTYPCWISSFGPPVICGTSTIRPPLNTSQRLLVPFASL